MALRIYTLSPVTVSSAGTAYAIAASGLAASVTIQADYSNTASIYIGDSSVSSSNGVQLAPGETAVIEPPPSATSTSFAEFKLENICVTATTSGDKARVSYIKRE